MHICAFVFVYECVYTCMRAGMYECVSTHTCVCVQVYVYECVCVCKMQ